MALTRAGALGLVRPRPPKYRDYDHVLNAGRLVRANLWRTPYTAHLLNHGISAGDVSAITVYRGLARNDADPSCDEFKLLEEFGLPQRDYEWEVMQDGLRLALRPPRVYRGARKRPVGQRSAAVPCGLGRDRGAASVSHRGSRPRAWPGDPNTTDGYRYPADQVQHVKPGERILAITTCIYVRYQHAIALQHLALPFGCSVDTAGIDFSAIGDDPNPLRFGAPTNCWRSVPRCWPASIW